MPEKTHCGTCGRKLRKKEFVWATNMPPMRRWLGHAKDSMCTDERGPSVTADQAREGLEQRKASNA